MTREEFWEWLATCPTHKYEATILSAGYITVTFKVPEDEE
tara:strand:+ start:1281 stop:1400 length:120 start_codon:yes stop_codon:yes gene_type:complete